MNKFYSQIISISGFFSFFPSALLYETYLRCISVYRCFVALASMNDQWIIKSQILVYYAYLNLKRTFWVKHCTTYSKTCYIIRRYNYFNYVCPFSIETTKNCKNNAKIILVTMLAEWDRETEKYNIRNYPLKTTQTRVSMHRKISIKNSNITPRYEK